jgi:hypothetical protein
MGSEALIFGCAVFAVEHIGVAQFVWSTLRDRLDGRLLDGAALSALRLVLSLWPGFNSCGNRSPGG